MGNNAIIIRTVGCHHNGRADIDAEQIAKRCVDELRANGHSILSASVESGGGSIDLLGTLGGSGLRGYIAENGALRPIEPTDVAYENWKLSNPDAPARAAYERYLAASGGKSLVSGAELPGWDALSPEIQAAWMAAVDHTKPRLQR
jgi:hypothetical protein